tara:strand:- start:185 stop:508 length:324 start_codon:yes stop_codon:yes gene_type:complete
MESDIMLGKNGPLVKVKWLDATNERGMKKINIDDPSEHLCYCETIGEVVAQDERAIVVVYHYTDFDGVDFICIPTSWVVEMEELKCIESLESQHVSQNSKQQKKDKS